MRGKSKARVVSAVILWAIGISLISFMVFSNQNETKTIDISGVKSDKIVAGYNMVEFEKVTQMSFVGRSYDMVMVGFADKTSTELTYLGLSSGKYYKSTEKISSSLLQEINKVGVIGQKLIIDYVKYTGGIIILSIWIFIGLGGIGFVVIYIKE